MPAIIPLKTGTNEHARAETNRKQRLFAWADLVLQQLGFADRVAQADSVDELRKVTFDADTIEVALAIRDSLHPASGKREEYFVGLSDAGLKRLLKTRFIELKKNRERALRGGASGRHATRAWSDDLVLDDAGGVRPLLTNLILFLREHPNWKGVLAYDEFNARVVVRKRLPCGDETLNATWTDHQESLTRTWFQREDIAAQHGDVGRAVQAAAGVLLVEVAELDALARASSSAIKAFLTRRSDRFRPPYGKHPISLSRQCVFAGTINPVAGGYLKDPTGARRIWPVACHGVIDRDALERDRDQLWAEAVTRYKAGAKWWLETPKLEALATAEQALRFKEDSWKGPISKWLGERQDASIAEVLEHALRITTREQTHSAEIRVANILTQLGFTKYRARKGNHRENRYQRGGEPDER